MGGAALLVVALSVALTVGAVAWRGGGPSRACAAMLQHVEALVVARDPSTPTRAHFKEARRQLLRRCEQMTRVERRCPMMATSIEEVQRCP